ncbi:MAG: hypothetical protein HYR74_03460 [Candidatus Eisenbacteria bacterium]|nr:hypothetical protein [Candidatus Eisenbacteria bacterium]
MSTAKPAAKRPRTPRRLPETEIGFSWGSANTVLLGLGVAALIAGYIALGHGSITLAPILLVSGYCGLIPASLLWQTKGVETGE